MRLPPRDRDVAMVFQSYALYPHMTIAENIAYPLRVRPIARHEIPGRGHDPRPSSGGHDGGRLQQFDFPLNIYEYPANRFVAGFMGSPSIGDGTYRQMISIQLA